MRAWIACDWVKRNGRTFPTVSDGSSHWSAGRWARLILDPDLLGTGTKSRSSTGHRGSDPADQAGTLPARRFPRRPDRWMPTCSMVSSRLSRTKCASAGQPGCRASRAPPSLSTRDARSPRSGRGRRDGRGSDPDCRTSASRTLCGSSAGVFRGTRCSGRRRVRHAQAENANDITPTTMAATVVTLVLLLLSKLACACRSYHGRKRRKCTCGTLQGDGGRAVRERVHS